ncbi:MAG: family 43 glycosylhydrolase [Bacteroidales bacterium]|nr:family 43 glycosylhydrolase [Bacteroidales bacterium]
MKKLIIAASVVLSLCSCAVDNKTASDADFTIYANPIIRNRHTSDPAPLVVGNTLYLYAGHDQCYEDKPGFEGQYGYNLTEWVLYSTQDMLNWKDHGVILKPTDFEYAIGEAWASQVIEYKGKYYFFTSMQAGAPYNSKVIGLAVGDSPTGPFKDYLGKPLVTDDMTDNGERGWWNDIDPTVLVDDDGSVWMSWGNGTCFLAKLTEDLTGIDGEIKVIELDNYVEGPWLHKKDGMYYLTYASMGRRGDEAIEYATATSLDGEWTCQGPLTGSARDSFTIHPGIANFIDNWYLFYHNGTLSVDGYGGSSGRRSVSVENLEYNEDGTMKFVTLTSQGIAPATSWHNSYEGMPIFQTKYTADPSPVVINDTIFIYTSHDEDDAQGYGFKMLNWILYTTTDMVNFTEHGVVASLDAFEWKQRDNGAWAQQVIPRNGKYYMYCPLHGNGIGVLVADSPYGPFVDPIGAPVVWQKEHWEDIDPTVLIDDGQAYMTWGNPNVYCVKLNEDMISADGEIMKLTAPAHYQEGPWTYKRDGKYYMAYASTCCPEGLAYSMADGPTGPWNYKGYIMTPTERDRGTHPGIVDYKGKSFIFGQDYDLLQLDFITAGEEYKHNERRSVSAAEMQYDADGFIQEVPYWLETKIEPLENFNPYQRVKASTIAWAYRMVTRQDEAGIYVTGIDNGDFISLRSVDFGDGASSFEAVVSQVKTDCTIEIRLDSKDGKVIGTVPLTAIDAVKAFSCAVKGAKGVHDLFFVFNGPESSLPFNPTSTDGLFQFRNWEFTQK